MPDSEHYEAFLTAAFNRETGDILSDATVVTAKVDGRQPLTMVHDRVRNQVIRDLVIEDNEVDLDNVQIVVTPFHSPPGC